MSNNAEENNKKHKMKDKIIDFFAGEIASALFFLIIGICLIAFPMHTMYFFTKIVFGLLLIFAGIYNVAEFLFGKKKITVFHMFAGVAVLVLGWYMFVNPEIIIEVLPQLLGGLVIVDSVWMMKASFRFYKQEDPIWKIFLPAGLVCFALGIVFALNPFSEVRHTVLFGGIVFILNGIADIIFYIMMTKEKKEDSAPDAPALHVPEKEIKKQPKENKFKNLFKGRTEKEKHFDDVTDSTAEQAPDAFAPQMPGGTGSEGMPVSPDLSLNTEEPSASAPDDAAQEGRQE